MGERSGEPVSRKRSKFDNGETAKPADINLKDDVTSKFSRLTTSCLCNPTNVFLMRKVSKFGSTKGKYGKERKAGSFLTAARCLR